MQNFLNVKFHHFNAIVFLTYNLYLNKVISTKKVLVLQFFGFRRGTYLGVVLI